MNKEVRAWLILLALQLAWIIPIGIDVAREKPVEEVEIEETEKLIQWKDEDAEEIVIEEVEIVIVQEQEAELESLGSFKLTAYCPCKKCSGKWGHQTSTGAIATEGRTVAVDPNVIPYGTILVIDGHEYIAEDCGGAIKGNRIDIFFESHEEALEFGVQHAEVFIKETE